MLCVYAGLGYMKEETQLSSLYLVLAVGPRLSALTFSNPTITGYISVKNESSLAIDLLETWIHTFLMQSCCSALLQLVCLNIDIFQTSKIHQLHST